jgi:hypothetical protein
LSNRPGKTSSDGLATLFELEMKGFLRQLSEQAIQQNTAMSKTLAGGARSKFASKAKFKTENAPWK